MSAERGLELDLQLTNRCPLTCDHCVYASSMSAGEGLSPARLPRLVDECVELGVSQVSITGGEPFLRQDLCDVVALIARRGIEVCAQTSGVLVDHMDFDALRASGLDLLLVSLDGVREHHERFRHAPGLFDRAVRTVERARAEGIAVRINTVVTRSNAAQVTALLPLAGALGVEVFSFFYFSPLGRGARYASEMLSFSEWLSVEAAVRAWCASGQRIPRMQIKLQNVTVPLNGIPAGGQRCRIQDRDNVLILANGDVYPCVFVCHQPGLRLGNILNESLVKVWRDESAWTSAYDAFLALTERDCGSGPANRCSGGCPAFRHAMRRPDGYCDRRCEYASTGLVPGCAREYTSA